MSSEDSLPPTSTDFSSTEVKPGDLLAGKYRVDKILGAGGMGVVVQATHTVLNDRVALKFLLPHVLSNQSVAQRFLREAQSAVRIKSPHVARVVDVGTLDSGSPYMVMEYLEGRDLGQMIEREGQLDAELACTFALQACEALAAAHSLGIVHRDIKPANLFITRGPDGAPVVKVLDFGISKVSSTDGMQALTQTSVSMGSPLYMSPEQMRSARDVDARADVWSMGVVLYEMLTGTLPFIAESMPQLCALVLETTAPPVRASRPDVTGGLEEAVLRCLQKRPEDRFATIAELATALAPHAGSFGAASAARITRILEGAGLGGKVDAKGARESIHALAQSAVALQKDAKINTSTAFGKTDAHPTKAPPAKKASVGLGLGIGAAVAVLVTGVYLLGARSGETTIVTAAPSEPRATAAAATAPVTAPTAEPSVTAAAAPAVVSAPEGEPDKAAKKISSRGAARSAPASAPAPKKEDPKPNTGSVFDDRK